MPLFLNMEPYPLYEPRGNEFAIAVIICLVLGLPLCLLTLLGLRRLYNERRKRLFALRSQPNHGHAGFLLDCKTSSLNG